MYGIRRATLHEVDIIVRHRRSMFFEMGFQDEDVLDRMSTAFRPWLAERLASGNYLGWFAVSGVDIVAGAGVWITEFPPTVTDSGSHRGLIVNVYTDPPHRRQGLARTLTRTVVDWCRANGIRTVILHASDQGRPIYTSLGFRPTNEMRLILE